MLGAAFSEYANRVQNGLTAPYVGLLSSDMVEVVFVVSDNGGLTVKVKDEPAAVVPVVLEAPIFDENLQTALLLKAETISPTELESANESLKVESKPKRKRKK